MNKTYHRASPFKAEQQPTMWIKRLQHVTCLATELCSDTHAWHNAKHARYTSARQFVLISSDDAVMQSHQISHVCSHGEAQPLLPPIKLDVILAHEDITQNPEREVVGLEAQEAYIAMPLDNL